MNLLACIVAIFVLVNVGDRLRLVTWKTAKAYVVVGLLVQLAIGFWVIWDSWAGHVAWWQWVAMCWVLLRLHLTRPLWRSGVPVHAQTAPGELGPAEFRRQ